MEPQKERLVMPGEELCTEEEFLPARSTYVENGSIYSAVLGNVDTKEGKVSVASSGAETYRIERGMLVIGTVVSEVGKVMFVKIDNIRSGGRLYVARGDGKIIQERRPMHGDMHSRAPSGKPCKEGDVILAKVSAVEEDVYTIDFYGPETGVVYAKCGNCGKDMRYDSNDRVLACDACGHREHERVSSLYGKPNEIKVLLARASVQQ